MAGRRLGAGSPVTPYTRFIQSLDK
jgi:hypothetical protein